MKSVVDVMVCFASILLAPTILPLTIQGEREMEISYSCAEDEKQMHVERSVNLSLSQSNCGSGTSSFFLFAPTRLSTCPRHEVISV